MVNDWKKYAKTNTIKDLLYDLMRLFEDPWGNDANHGWPE